MKPPINLLQTTSLPDFPSGSSINYRNGKFYLIGDDANDILVLDQHHTPIQTFKLFNYPEKRIPKPIKADLEAATFIIIDDQEYFIIAGSASKPQREKVYLIPVNDHILDLDSCKIKNDDEFTDLLKEQGITEVNLEGMTVVNQHLILTNRGNRENPENHLLITKAGFWKKDDIHLKILQVKLPAGLQESPTISEICYVDSLDLLLITLSTEASDNAYDDGAIGNSYIGWINNVSTKLNSNVIGIDSMINLSDADQTFKGEKIEGVCVESIDNAKLTVHLVSDNDNGESKVFKLYLTI